MEGERERGGDDRQEGEQQRGSGRRMTREGGRCVGEAGRSPEACRRWRWRWRRWRPGGPEAAVTILNRMVIEHTRLSVKRKS